MVFKKWIIEPSFYKNKNFINFIKVVKVYKILSGLRNMSLELFFSYKYGSNFKHDRIGMINLHNTKFKFYDPHLHYLLKDCMGEKYEPAITYHLKSLINSQSKTCFLDLGAHFGIYTAFIGALNKNCKIYSFEPNKEAFEILSKNVIINNIDAKVYDIALSDKSGKIPFFGRSMKVKDKSQSYYVKSMSFDTLRNKENIYPDIVKLDVHGAEGKVLYGMKKALKNDIKHLFCELHPQNLLVDYSFKDILDILQKSGFELYEVMGFRNKKFSKITKITDHLYNQIINKERWTGKQELDRRMLYATKDPKFF